MSQKRLNKIRGLEHHDRLDEALYHDYESEDARKVGGGGGLVPGGSMGGHMQ